MTTVTGKLIGFAAPQRAEMRATLVDVTGAPAVGYVASVPGEVVRPVAITPDTDGDWTVTLTPNADIESDAGDTLWAIQEGRAKDGTPIISYVVVPATGSHWVGTIRADLGDTQTGQGTVVYLPGPPGTPGTNGADGEDGTDGLSAFQIAQANGFTGTEAEWLASLVGPAGQDGSNADAEEYTDSAIAAEVLRADAAYDPTGAAATALSAAATDATNKVTTHTNATDPHGDKAYADGKLAKAQNLADLPDPSAARTALDLGNAATRSVGTTTGTVAAGDDSRLSNSRTPTAHAASHTEGGSDPVTVTQDQVTGLTDALEDRLPLDGGIITGNLTVARADGLGGYRLRTTGGELDLEIAGKDVYISHWDDPDFEGDQKNLMRLGHGNPHFIGRSTFGAATHDAIHALDATTGVAELGARNSLARVRVSGRRATAGPPTTGVWDEGDTVQDVTGAWWLCTAGGTPGTWTSPTPAGGAWTPADQGLASWSMDPASCTGAGTTLSAGFIYAVKLLLRQATTLNRVHAVLGTAGSGLTAGQCLAGYYDTAGNRLGVTADQSTVWNSAGNKSMALTAPVAVPAGAVYAALLFNGTTSPSFAAGSTHGATFTPGNANLAAGAYRFCRSAAGQTSLPTTVSLAAFTADANNVWAGAS